jgi:hypothetical protein
MVIAGGGRGDVDLTSGLDIIHDVTMRTHKVKRSSMVNETNRAARKMQTTLRLPRQLYERAKLFVESEKMGSVNDFIVNALSAYVRAMERKAIDDAFAGMATDKQYQREALRIAEEFAASDAEALELTERDLAGA